MESTADNHAQLGWPITKAMMAGCTTFCFPDRLGDGQPYTRENFAHFPTLELLGIEDWDRQLINSLVPDDRPFAVWTLSSTWQMTKLSRWHREGRAALAEGIRWERKRGGQVFGTFPPRETAGGQKLLEYVGFDNERCPEFIFVPLERAENWDTGQLVRWSQSRELWSAPFLLVPQYAERILALQDGWLYLAVISDVSSTITRIIDYLAGVWNLRLIDGPPEWKWIT